MGKLYLRAAAVLVLVSPSAGAQTREAVQVPPLGSTLTANALADLPSGGGNLFTLLDTVIPEVITERVDSGGLNVGGASRLGAHGSSWTQTVFRLDGVDIDDGDGSGTPLLLPGVLTWERVDVSTGLLPIDVNAASVAVSLAPRRPTAAWTGVAEGLMAGPSPQTGAWPQARAPAIARLRSSASASVLLSGPLLPDRVGLVLAGTWNAASRYERAETTPVDANQGSAFMHVVVTPSEGGKNELRAIAWVQQTSTPLEDRLAFGQPSATETRRAAHGQLVWERRTSSGGTSGVDRAWSAFAGYSVRQRTQDLTRAASIVINRVNDGPAEALLYPGPGTDTHWSAGVRFNAQDPRGASPQLRAPAIGVEVSGTGVRMRPAFGGRVGETINGLPSRIWEFSDPGLSSQWNETTIAAYAADRVQVHSRVTLDGGIRVERLRGSAEGASTVSWTDLLPRAGIRWHLTDVGRIAVLAGYSRTTHRLSLTDLAWGDATTPTGGMYRWNSAAPGVHAPSASERGALVARVGPGAGTVANFSTIDPNLKRPHMDELSFGFEGRPRPDTVFRFMGIGRRERDLIGVVNTGVPESAYSVIPFSDPGLFGDNQILPIFNRPVSTFGADRYLLTNPDGHQTTFVGAELMGQRETERLFLLFGVTAGRSEGLSANRGFRAIENDAALLGEVFTNPNARTYAQGRLFTERGYTIKLTTVYRFPHDFRVGLAARYQDGQHFSRLAVVPNLNQGPEIVRAFRNGRTRFTFTGTLDARVQKGFTSGARRIALVLEGYNILDSAYEIEEFQVSGPLSRSPTAVQPPPTLHAGIRIEF